MRLSEINYYINKLNIEGHVLEYSYLSQTSSMLENIINFKALIKEIEDYTINFYEKEISILKKSEIYETSSNTLSVTVQIRSLLINNAMLIVDSLTSLKVVLERVTPERNENSFLIKLPQSNNFEEIANDMSKIQRQLHLVLSDKKIDSSMHINNWEYGSFWIDIVIGTQLALGLIASITWTAAYIKKELKKNEEANLYLERIGHENEHIKKVQETQKKYIDKIYENEILNIQENHYDDEKDPERNVKIKKTIELFANILSRGGEFQPSLIAPEKMKKNFPDLKNIANIESKIKQITEKTEGSEE